MFATCGYYRVNYMGGDANSAMYRHFSNHICPGISDSSFVVCLKRCINALSRSGVNVGFSYVVSNLNEYIEIFEKLRNAAIEKAKSTEKAEIAKMVHQDLQEMLVLYPLPK